MKPKKKFSLFRILRNGIKSIFERFVLWFYAHLFTFFLTFLVSLKRHRMSHDNGIAGTGWLKILDNPEVPEHEFFPPGKQFEIRVRHASAAFLDDAMKCVRSISIKFSPHRYKSPLDLELNSGQPGPFWSALSFLKFAKLKKQKYGVEFEEFNKKYPDGSVGASTSFRRNATSFHNVRYYTKTAFLFIPKSGIKHYCKYKVRPFEDIPESGVEENPSLQDAPNQRILPHETRGRNYLKDEYISRIKKGPLKYKLQIQLRVASDDEDPEIFNIMKPWDEKLFPFIDLAEFEVNHMLDWKESTKTTFSMKNMPKLLGIIPAKSIYDYNSLNYMRKVSDFARRARLFSYRIWGMVPEIPDNDDRNTDEWSEPD